jgi:methylated-DNA-[protein]-cysteine S-methyltransferase
MDMSTIEDALRGRGGRAVRDASAGAAKRFAGRAAAAGLLDVAYTVAGSPFGDLFLAVTPHGLVRVGFRPERVEDVVEELARRISPRVLEAPARLDDVRRELDEYFNGRRRQFTVALDWQLSHGFAERVLRATARIPYGHVSTYRDMAARAGNPRAMRAAGNALGGNPLPIVVPCHRVVRTGGAVGNYGGGPKMKRALLQMEGAIED